MGGGRGARPVVLAGPSGTGKTSIARQLVREGPEYTFSISATTRPRRANEEEGVDYLFVTPEEFDRLIGRDELLEWAEVHGHRYGTPEGPLRRSLDEGRHVVLDIDVQGARQVRSAAPDALLVFVLPPTADALVRRLTGRATERRPDLVRRLRNAREELLEAPGFHHAVVNERLGDAVRQVRALVEGGREELPERAETVQEVVSRLRAEIGEVLAEMERDERDGDAVA